MRKNILPKIFQENPPSRIYYADKTTFFYRATPDGSLIFAKTQLIGSMKAMDRMVVFCGAHLSDMISVPCFLLEKVKYRPTSKDMTSTKRLLSIEPMPTRT